jgi:hypothetical protein
VHKALQGLQTRMQTASVAANVSYPSHLFILRNHFALDSLSVRSKQKFDTSHLISSLIASIQLLIATVVAVIHEGFTESSHNDQN